MACAIRQFTGNKKVNSKYNLFFIVIVHFRCHKMTARMIQVFLVFVAITIGSSMFIVSIEFCKYTFCIFVVISTNFCCSFLRMQKFRMESSKKQLEVQKMIILCNILFELFNNLFLVS